MDIAYEVKDKMSTDPRDRLYGILGLALIRGATRITSYGRTTARLYRRPRMTLDG